MASQDFPRLVIALAAAVGVACSTVAAEDQGTHCLLGDCEGAVGWQRVEGSGAYAGEFRNGRPNGLGTWVSKGVPPTVYQGEFRDGLFHGTGVLIEFNGRRFVGEFDEHPVRGSMTWPDGRRYRGEVSMAGPDGRGEMTYPDGTVHSGVWKLGKLVEANE